MTIVDDVWVKIHGLGGWLFIVLEIITLTAIFYLKYFVTIFL